MQITQVCHMSKLSISTFSRFKKNYVLACFLYNCIKQPVYSKARPNHLAETLCGNAGSFSKFTSCVPCVSSASVCMFSSCAGSCLYVMCIRPLHMRLLPSSAYLQQQKIKLPCYFLHSTFRCLLSIISQCISFCLIIPWFYCKIIFIKSRQKVSINVS